MARRYYTVNMSSLKKPTRRRLSEERRVIFPSLHGAASSRDHHAQTKPAIKSYSPNNQEVPRSHTPPMDDNIIVHSDRIPKQFTASHSHISPKGPIERSNSLDDLVNSLQPLSFNKNVSVQPRNSQTKTLVANRNIFPPNLNLSPPQSSDRKIFIFPQGKTFYPATTVPTFHEGPGRKLLSESHNKASALQRKPLPSILRSKGGRSSPSTVIGDASSTADQEVIISTPQNQFQLSPNMPTLASPTSIKTLSPSIRSHGSNDTLSEAEVIERISDEPKLLPKPKTILKRNQSDTAVCINEGGERQRLRRLSEGNENDQTCSNSRSSSSSVTSWEGCVSRHASFESVANNKKPKIGFDPHVWIHEYNPQLTVGELWFTEEELAEFKHEAIERVRLQRQRSMVPTGTGRIVEVTSKGSGKANEGQRVDKAGPVRFNHPALGCDDEVDTDDAEKMIQDAISREIRNVLLVDVHEIFLALFTRLLRSLFPHISVTTARSGEEAISRIEAAQKAFPQRDGGSLHGFDIILVEERLGSPSTQLHLTGNGTSSTQAAGDDSVQRRRMTSGSELISSIVQGEQKVKASTSEQSRCALLIGVSAHFTQDLEVMKKSGADILWAKPPPEMNVNQRNHLLQVLMKKRGRENLIMFE